MEPDSPGLLLTSELYSGSLSGLLWAVLQIYLIQLGSFQLSLIIQQLLTTKAESES